mgnify:CR=1 FL=1
MPGGAVYPEMFDPPLPAGKLAEEYYAELLHRMSRSEGPEFQGARSGEAGRSGQGDGQSEGGFDSEPEAGRGGFDAGDAKGRGSGFTGGSGQVGASHEAGDADGSQASGSSGQASDRDRSEGHPRGSGTEAGGAETPAPGAGRCGSCATGQAEPWEEPPPDQSEVPGVLAAEAELIRRQVAQEIIRIAQSGTMAGKLPGHWVRWAEEKLSPKVDWRRELAAAVRQAVSSTQGAADYTYRRPSRRQAAYREVVMPSLYWPIPEVAVVVDTSSSMSDRQVAQALAEVAGILRGLGNRTAVRVLAVDAAVQTCQRVFRPEQLELRGGGGTDMGVGLEAALESRGARLRPEVVVVITDGHTPWPERPPANARVIVALVGDGQAPAWAKTIKIEA